MKWDKYGKKEKVKCLDSLNQLNEKFELSSFITSAALIACRCMTCISESASPETALLGNMSRVRRKLDFCLCENKGADQLCSNCTADQRLCFRYSDSTIPLLLIAKISSIWPASVTVQAGLCRTWSEIPKTGFLASRLKYVCGRLPG